MTQTYCLRALATITGVPDEYREAQVIVPLPDGVSVVTPEIENQYRHLVGGALDKMIADASLSGALLENVTYEAIPTPDSLLDEMPGGGA